MNTEHLESAIRELPNASFENIGEIMREYQRHSGKGQIPMKSPYVILLKVDKAFTLAERLEEQSPLNDKTMRGLLLVSEAILRYVERSMLAYVEHDAVSILVDADSPHLLGDIDKLDSLCASLATLTFLKHCEGTLVLDRPLFECRSFAVHTADVPLYFVWRQLDSWRKCVDAALWGALAPDKGAQGRVTLLTNIQDKLSLYNRTTSKNAHDLETRFKRGIMVRRGAMLKAANQDNPNSRAIRRKEWVADLETPIFSRPPGNFYLLQVLQEPELELERLEEGDEVDEQCRIYCSLPSKGLAAYREKPLDSLDDPT